MEKTASQVLMAARALISDPAVWGQGQYGMSGSVPGGRICSAMAIYEAASPCEAVEREPAYRYLKSVCGRGVVAYWNDDPRTTHADVMAAFDRAIALAEKDEAPQREPRETDDAYTKRVIGEIVSTAHGTRVDAMTSAEQVEKT